jgi:hypothetical protein
VWRRATRSPRDARAARRHWGGPGGAGAVSDRSTPEEGTRLVAQRASRAPAGRRTVAASAGHLGSARAGTPEVHADIGRSTATPEAQRAAPGASVQWALGGDPTSRPPRPGARSSTTPIAVADRDRLPRETPARARRGRGRRGEARVEGGGALSPPTTVGGAERHAGAWRACGAPGATPRRRPPARGRPSGSPGRAEAPPRRSPGSSAPPPPRAAPQPPVGMGAGRRRGPARLDRPQRPGGWRRAQSSGVVGDATTRGRRRRSRPPRAERVIQRGRERGLAHAQRGPGPAPGTAPSSSAGPRRPR